jgi:hypothetical protein
MRASTVATSAPYSNVTTFLAEIVPRGIEIDAVLYRAIKFSKETREQLASRLQNEPLEYTGTRPYSVEHERPPCQQ